ncbi:endolytic transglycosylase MltG [Candidatus Parcubacteria bacterium]|nr:endolytic transglycosylase MltG [Candidatus Parcubacteria bacterium]
MSKLLKLCTILVIAVLVGLTYLYTQIFVPVNAGTYPFIVEVVSGENLSSVSDKLHAAHVTKNKFVFENFVKLIRQDSKIQIGEYTFKRPLNMIEIIDKLASARYEYDPVIITIKEGEDSRTITDTIFNNFKNVSGLYTREQVLEMVKAKEGYMFPETYNYAPWVTIDRVFEKMDTEFAKRTAKYNLNSEELKRILTIASILEKEVPHPEDMKIVAGIINNRLQKGMPLQMDSTLGYFTGKASLELTTADLQLDSPYNTYKIKGLPSGPIGNPGDVAIEAAMNPNINEYVFFLSDKEGINHYAKTYEEHLRNRKLYLGK